MLLPLLETRQLVVQTRGHHNPLVSILDSVNIILPENKITALLGETGCGKTTLARTLVNLLPENLHLKSGQILYKNKPIHPQQLDQLRGTRIFYAPQEAAACLNPVLKIKHQLNLFSKTKITWSHILECFLRLQFTEPQIILNKYPFQLSGGESQRCLWAMALLPQPQLLILDEPTSALDPLTKTALLDLLRAYHQNHHMTVLLITHDLGFAVALADYIYIMRRGQIIDYGETTLLFKNSTHPYTQQIATLIKN